MLFDRCNQHSQSYFLLVCNPNGGGHDLPPRQLRGFQQQTHVQNWGFVQE